MIYGATGYTGRLLTARARERGLDAVLAGRSRERLAALGPRAAVAVVDDPAALRAAFAGAGVVVNAAGPFHLTARPVLQACLDVGAHYLNVGGEGPVFEALNGYNDAARHAKILVMPGAGFVVAASDCLAAHVAARLPNARSLWLGFSRADPISRGSLGSMLDLADSRVTIRRGGRLVAIPAGSRAREFDFGAGASSAMVAPWPDPFSACLTTGIPNIEAYLEADSLTRSTYRAASLFAPALKLAPARRTVDAMTSGWPEGPSEAEREFDAQGDRRRGGGCRRPSGRGATVHAERLHVHPRLRHRHRRTGAGRRGSAGLLDAGRAFWAGFHLASPRCAARGGFRMTSILHRTPRTPLPQATGGQGVYLFDADGKRYLDASGGAAVSCLGHGHPRVIEAIRRQAERLAYAHTAFFTTEPAERLADFLVARAPGLTYVYFVSGGSEAVETALKLARQYFVEIGEPERDRFIARRQSYHGNTLGALALGGNAFRREPFLPLLAPTIHVSPCYAYRDRRDDESDADYGDRLAAELEAAIVAAGPRRVAAFVAETVVGATLGAVPPVVGYFAKMRAVCDRHGVLLILDEVMSGMGRTGRLFACEEDGVMPDIVTIAKGLGGGYQPIGATLCTQRIRDAIVGGSGFFQHGHTYIGHAIACAAALAVQETIEDEGLLVQVRARGERLQAELKRVFAEHPHVGDVRGRGLLVGVELVEDRASKAPFDPARRVHARVKAEAFARGLIVYPMGGTVDGRRGDHVLLAPPFIASEAEIDEVVARLAAALSSAL